MPGMISARLNDLAVGESLRLAGWPVSPGDHRTISVKRRSIYASGARILEIGEHGARELPRSKHRHFVGEIDDIFTDGLESGSTRAWSSMVP